MLSYFPGLPRVSTANNSSSTSPRFNKQNRVMKKKYFIILKYAVIAAFIMVGLASCVEEDNSGCVDPRGNVCVTVLFDEITKSTPGFVIDGAHVYVFDTNNRYVTSASGGAHVPGTEYQFFLTLNSGNYKFVVWTNPGEIYKINKTFAQCEGQSIGDLNLYLDTAVPTALTQDIPDLLWGSKSQQVYSGVDNLVPIDLTINTYDINVKVTGLPATNDEYKFAITDNNSHFTFDNAIIPGTSDFTYTRFDRQVSGELNVSFRVLKLSPDRNPSFVITNSGNGELLFNSGLVRTILSAYNQSEGQTIFNTTHVFDIVLTRNADMSFTVTVNDWDYTEGGGNLK